MRDIILGRKVGSGTSSTQGGPEKRMVEACERPILEFPLDMDAREVAKEAQNARVVMLGLRLHKYDCSDRARAGKKRGT
jgi:hypothetical protein